VLETPLISSPAVPILRCHLHSNRLQRHRTFVPLRRQISYHAMPLSNKYWIKIPLTDGTTDAIFLLRPPPGGQGCEVLQSACLYVCLFFFYLLASLKNHTCKFYQIFFSGLLTHPRTAMRYVMYFRFRGWRHVFTSGLQSDTIDAYVSSGLPYSGTRGRSCRLRQHPFETLLQFLVFASTPASGLCCYLLQLTNFCFSHPFASPFSRNSQRASRDHW